MIIQSKKLIPEIYSQSYDFSIFTGLLDMLYTARELDVLRAKNAHSPENCFEEDLTHLASLLNLPYGAKRELISDYRSLVKQKGTRDAIVALAEHSMTLNSKNGYLVVTTNSYDADDNVYSVTKSMTIIENEISKASVTRAYTFPNDENTDFGKIVKTTIHATVYLDFSYLNYQLLSHLIKRLASANTFVQIRYYQEYENYSATDFADSDEDSEADENTEN